MNTKYVNIISLFIFHSSNYHVEEVFNFIISNCIGKNRKG